LPLGDLLDLNLTAVAGFPTFGLRRIPEFATCKPCGKQWLWGR
jgi:hypothetical protein